MTSLSDLREKDVINVCDGKRVGYVCDITLDETCGKICALVVSPGYIGFCAGKHSITVPWENIQCVGEDTVLVTAPVCKNECDSKVKKGFFCKF